MFLLYDLFPIVKNISFAFSQFHKEQTLTLK